MVQGNNIKIGHSTRTSIKDAETLQDGEIGDLYQEYQPITETEGSLVIATLEAIIEIDHNPVIEIYTEEDLTPEAVRTMFRCK